MTLRLGPSPCLDPTRTWIRNPTLTLTTTLVVLCDRVTCNITGHITRRQLPASSCLNVAADLVSSTVLSTLSPHVAHETNNRKKENLKKLKPLCSRSLCSQFWECKKCTARRDREEGAFESGTNSVAWWCRPSG